MQQLRLFRTTATVLSRTVMDETLSATDLAQADAWGAEAEALRRMSGLVSDRVGPIKSIILPKVAFDYGRLHVAITDPARIDSIAGVPARNRGIGATMTRSRAVVKAVGETVERYCAAFVDDRKMFFATAIDSPLPTVRPRQFALFSSEQYELPTFPYAPFTDTVPCNWLPGTSLASGRQVAAPAACVYLPYRYDETEPVFDDGISTGLACGLDVPSAVYRGLCEAIERDAFMVCWRNRLSRPRIRLRRAPVPGPIEEILTGFEDTGLLCQLVYLTLDIDVPVVLVALRTDPPRPPFVSVGIGAAADVHDAALHALEEAWLTYWGLSRAMASLDNDAPTTPRTIDDQALAFARDSELAATMAFMTSSEQEIDLDDVSAPRAVEAAGVGGGLHHIVGQLSCHGLEAVWFDLTTPDIYDLGLKVVRVLCPGLQALDTQHRYHHQGGRRLYDIGMSLGIRQNSATLGDLNPDPHPFP